MGDIVDTSSLYKIFQSINSAVGAVDILIANSGYMPDLLSVKKADPENWWNDFEVNVKGTCNLVSAFVSVGTKSVSINISTAAANLPYVPGGSGYTISKLSGTRLFDYVAKEYPEFFVLNVQSVPCNRCFQVVEHQN